MTGKPKLPKGVNVRDIKRLRAEYSPTRAHGSWRNPTIRSLVNAGKRKGELVQKGDIQIGMDTDGHVHMSVFKEPSIEEPLQQILTKDEVDQLIGRNTSFEARLKGIPRGKIKK